MKRNRYVIFTITILLLCACLYGCGRREQQSGITWQENEDGSYTFINNDGEKGSIYAWYVLDENGEVIDKIGYSKSPKFTYDLKGNRNLTIKGFIRTGTEDEYDQTSLKVSAENILYEDRFTIISTDMPEGFIECVRETINADVTLPVDSVLEKDGSKWEVDLTIPVNWDCPDITKRSYGLRTNGLLFLDGIYEAYCATHDEKYADVIKSYLLDWVNQNTKYDADQWAWHDDATALRVKRMSLFYYECKELYSKNERKIIEESLKYQAQLLSTNEFYKEKHNHGMHQDEALLIYALLFEDNDTKRDYISIALNRTSRYLDYVYTDDGVHKEHSPFYAGDVADDIIFWKKVTENISPDFSAYIGRYVDGAKEYLVHCIKPDGMWPSLGDTSSIDGIQAVKKILDNDDEYEWIISGNGKIPETEQVFPEGGYAMFRSSWGDEKATWMMLVAATFSSTHKHGDDLEVLLYHKGDLFVEAGKRNYTYLDEMTTWAYSGYGHNVLLVNGEAYPVKVSENGFQSIYPEALQTGITEYNLDGDTLSVTGKEYRFENVEQERTLSYDKANDTVIISDVLEAIEDFDGTLLYHIAEGVEVEENSSGWNLYRDNELVAVVSVEGNVDFELSTIAGVGTYPYCTWIFNGSDEPTHGSLLMINISGRIGENQVDTIVDLK